MNFSQWVIDEIILRDDDPGERGGGGWCIPSNCVLRNTMLSLVDNTVLALRPIR